MIERSPARNATGSSVAIEARELPVESSLELGVERRPAVRVRRRFERPRAAPTPDEDRDDRGGAENAGKRQEPGEPVEAFARRRREHRRPELRDQLVLDLLLRGAGLDLLGE